MLDEKDPDASNSHGSVDPTESKPEDWDDVGRLLNSHWREVWANGGRYLAAHTDLIQVRLGRYASYVAAGGFLVVITVAICVVAVVFGVRGLATVLEQLYGGRRWASDLTVAFVLLGTVFVAGRIGVKVCVAALQRGVKERYESRRRQAE